MNHFHSTVDHCAEYNSSRMSLCIHFENYNGFLVTFECNNTPFCMVLKSIRNGVIVLDTFNFIFATQFFDQLKPKDVILFVYEAFKWKTQ